LNQEPPITDVTRYKYDEAGNRVRKTTYRNNSSNPDPLPEEEEDIPPGWSIIVDDYYSRDATGKEIAIYSTYTIQYWNVWSGGEITGRINFTENEARFYYLKDHLGSIRVVLDNSKNVVSANDFDMWGYYLENRSYSTNNTKNKFTGKERDTESNWDYFGARYYDARVGRWGQMDPYYNKYQSFTPYIYSFNNPIKYIDPDGKDAIIEVLDNNKIRITLNYVYIKYNTMYERSLNLKQVEWLKQFETNTEKSWSKEYIINGQKYNVTVEVNLVEVNNPGEAAEKMEIIEGATFIQSDFENVLKSQPENFGVGVAGNYMYMSIDNLNPFKDTGAHEAGHLMGLKGELFGFGIMHHKIKEYEFRDVPRDKDFSNIINFNKLTLAPGLKTVLKTFSEN